MRSIFVPPSSSVSSLLDTDSSATATVAVHRVRSLKTWHLALVTAIVGTVAYYLPLLGALMPGHAHWPGFLLTGDQRMGYFPSFVEGYRRFWHGGLLGIDFLTDDGASVFAYRPNLMPFYPPFLLAYLLVDCSELRTGVLAFVAIHVAHQFVGLYFTVVFVRRYLRFPGGAAVLAATIYGLGWYAATYAGEATFYFQIMLLPVAACALCWLMQARSRLAPIWMSPVFVTFVLSNYGPTMLASLGLAVVAALIAFSLWEPAPGPRRLRALAAPLVSLAVAGLVCAPYFYAQLRFKAVMAPTADDIDPVAHTLALTAYDLLNGLSPFLDIHRTHYEAFLVWGAVPVFLCLFGLDVLLSRKGHIRPHYLWVSGVAAIIYLASLLPTLGSSLLAAADAFYYAVPFLGKMHIFQRYLAFSNLFFAIMVAGLAGIAVLYASPAAKKIAAYAGIAIWLGVTIACLVWPPGPPTDVNGLLVEVFLVAAAGIAVAAAPPTPALLVVSVLCALTGLYNAYAIPLSTNRLSVWTAEPDPLGPEIGDIVSFIRANDDGKALSKVVLASTVIESYFNRNLPWLLGKQVKLMNFQGYPPHLAVLSDYLTDNYSAFGTFNVPWLQEAGADFVFWNAGAPAPLEPLVAAGFVIGPTLALPGGNMLGKLTQKADAKRPVIDLRPDNAAAWPKATKLDGWAVENGHLVKASNQEAGLGYSVTETPGHVYDVDFDVDVTSAGRIDVAFASQVLTGLDLPEAPVASHFHQQVAAATIGDLWITASPTFAGSLSNVMIKLATDADGAAVPEPERAGFDNGILRVSGPEGAVQGFGTDYTRRIRLVLDQPTTRTVTYLLWPSPYMVPYLDGKQTAWADASARPLSIDVGPGRHTLDIRFKSASGDVFVWGQIGYLVLIAATLIAEFARRSSFLGGRRWATLTGVRPPSVRSMLGRVAATRAVTAAPAQDAEPRRGRDPFRPDLNGLRAMAVLAVILFHYRVVPFSGGFVGVDVFFVLSGYLMTQILVAGVKRPDFRIWRFYLERLARIVPGLLVMTVAILALGSAISLPGPYVLMAREALASVLFAVNVHFATDTGYFAPAAAQSWFLHCWSLAVEFQFYIAYPLILVLARRIGGARGVLAALLGGALLSAGYALVETRHDPTLAFYLVFSRFWEFVAGGLVLFLPPPTRARDRFALGGLALVALSVFWFNDTQAFPALWPALPVAGAVAVIWARSATRVLANPAAQFLGAISYSLYLWHWPLLLAGRYFGLVDRPAGLWAVFVVTVAVAWLSFRFVETPFRVLFRRVSIVRALGGASAIAAVVAACLAIVTGEGLPGRIPENVSILAEQAVYPDWRQRKCFLDPEQDFASFAPECFARTGVTGKPRLLLWGNSIAAALYPGITDQNWASNYSIEQATASDCAQYDNDEGVSRPNCPNIRRGIRAFVHESKPDIVLLGTPSTLPKDIDPFLSNYVQTIQTSVRMLAAGLLSDGIGRVILVGPAPKWDLPLPEVYFRERFRTGSADPDMMPPVQIARLRQFDRMLRDAIESAGGTYVSIVDRLCRENLCHAQVPTDTGLRLLQFDTDHLTQAGSDWVAGNLIGPALGEAVSTGKPVTPNVKLDFQRGAPGTRYFDGNWMIPEVWGTWVRGGKTGWLVLPILGTWRPSRVVVEYWGILSSSFPRERMWMRIEGDPPVPLDIDLAHNIVTSAVDLRPGAIAQMMATGFLKLQFWAPDAKSPDQLGLNNDTRVLGFGLRHLTLQ